MKIKLIENSNEALKVADSKGRIALGSKNAGKYFAVREEADGSTHLIPVLIVLERDRPLTSRQLAGSFAGLETLTENWDGYGSSAPSTALIASAREVLALLQADAMARSLVWQEPHISVNERGQITIEWWHNDRTLTVFVRSEEQVDFLKTWGSDIVSEMEDGQLVRISDFIALSRWLYPQETTDV